LLEECPLLRVLYRHEAVTILDDQRKVMAAVVQTPWRELSLLKSVWPRTRCAASTVFVKRRRQSRQSHGLHSRAKLPRSENASLAAASGSKVFASADEAIADLKDGTVILSAGFGLSGVAGTA
jgi:hypothetical protein